MQCPESGRAVGARKTTGSVSHTKRQQGRCSRAQIYHRPCRALLSPAEPCCRRDARGSGSGMPALAGGDMPGVCASKTEQGQAGPGPQIVDQRTQLYPGVIFFFLGGGGLFFSANLLVFGFSGGSERVHSRQFLQTRCGLNRAKPSSPGVTRPCITQTQTLLSLVHTNVDGPCLPNTAGGSCPVLPVHGNMDPVLRIAVLQNDHTRGRSGVLLPTLADDSKCGRFPVATHTNARRVSRRALVCSHNTWLLCVTAANAAVLRSTAVCAAT